MDDLQAELTALDRSDILSMATLSTLLEIDPGSADFLLLPSEGDRVACGRSVSIADKLRKLAELRDEGILTWEEFAAQKARLLER